MATRAPRSVAEMAQALRVHVSLLHRYVEAVRQGDGAFLGEIAGKLRLLVIAKGRNKPLLLRLAELTGDELTVVLSGAIRRGRVSLETYLGMDALHLRSAISGEMLQLSYGEFVSTWAQQYGASHEDWSLSEPFHISLAMNVQVGGIDVNARILLNIAHGVLQVADAYLSQLTDDKVAAAEAEMRRRHSTSASTSIVRPM